MGGLASAEHLNLTFNPSRINSFSFNDGCIFNETFGAYRTCDHILRNKFFLIFSKLMVGRSIGHFGNVSITLILILALRGVLSAAF